MEKASGNKLYNNKFACETGSDRNAAVIDRRDAAVHEAVNHE